ncbi:MAG: stage 0 sporulation family protein [Clostridiales bacterium]|nr:stage 0 sporulation family protein [Clostridiales bacterium]
MASVVGVRFKNAGKLYYFDPGPLWPMAGSFVIVETARGQEYGQVITGVRQVEDQLITVPLKKVVRLADAKDAEHALENERFQAEAFRLCQRKIEEHKLDMKLVSVEQTFDNAKILFYFTANGRVDFRSLVKDLASVFRTRIELRQIGVRDEAKMMGGLGPCGRPICCGTFLGDFQPVSIKMAKEQNLSLNPTKISGVCGRLMCCLKYEQDHYEQTRKRMPKIGKEVETPDGMGIVVDISVLKETLTVRIRRGDSSEQKTYALADVKWSRPAPQQGESAQRFPKEGREYGRSQGQPPSTMGRVSAPPRQEDVFVSEDEIDTDELDLDIVGDSALELNLLEEELPREEAAADSHAEDWRHAVEEALSRAEKNGSGS